MGGEDPTASEKAADVEGDLLDRAADEKAADDDLSLSPVRTGDIMRSFAGQDVLLKVRVQLGVT